MPPKAKVTKDMIINAAINVVREAGVENINARTVAKKLNCSTQPVMYHFETIEESYMRKMSDVCTCMDWNHTDGIGHLLNLVN